MLTDITLTLQPGTVTTLVGPSGAGKTTLARLVPWFFDPRSGTIPDGGLYRHLGFVFQEVRCRRPSLPLGWYTGERVCQLSTLPQPANPITPADTDIEFDQVNFGYDDRPVLTDVTAGCPRAPSPRSSDRPDAFTTLTRDKTVLVIATNSTPSATPTHPLPQRRAHRRRRNPRHTGRNRWPLRAVMERPRAAAEWHLDASDAELSRAVGR